MNKYRVIASVHEGGVWEQRFKALEQAIKNAYGIVDPNASVSVVWQRIPAGQAYLAGEPSTTSTVVPPVPVDIKQEIREQFMHAVCQEWMEITGCSVNEIIVNAMNEDMVAKYMQISQGRLSKSKAKSRFALMFITALLKKWLRGYTSFNINLKS
ncbi:hypothetical protein [Pseudoteredinibacter isoporae]|uniref:Tautomerase enzyme n=1 Tax=Pseudoteredinibacter isoporae TaxID=570281 RepID=A0A7X0MUT7_9GAMM|nr:hypothetical protein [Pseudoteredinibacter isoporae]MBB6520638.1 hypothetical protein [Pseudoteredinibacter isoporae]NHO86205.1 hypothetical protein [Pseudoteredinibacter isoporae]NIB25344.1 hypothetical protein [Pseudoteredinibacter isoporae]